MKKLTVCAAHTDYNQRLILTIPQEFMPTNTKFYRLFLDLLQRIFVYDPKQRITAKDALKHPWFKESLTDDGTEALRIGQQLQRNGQQR
jgi:dual-specificity kinase